MFGTIGLLILLGIIASVVYGIVAWRRRDTTPEIDPGIGTVRRIYFYVVSFVTLAMAGNGIVLIIRFILNGVFSGPTLSSSSTPLAIGAALTIVGLPLWLLHWRLVQKYVREMPVETHSIARKLHTYLVLGVSGGLVLYSSVGILQWIFQTGRFSGYNWGAVIVWSAVWVFFWRAETAEGQDTDDTRGIRRFYLYAASLATLVMLSIGFGRVIHMLLLAGYDALFTEFVIIPRGGGIWQPALASVVALSIVGGAAWAVHWLYFVLRDYGSSLRQTYLYVFAILGGVVTFAISLGVIINAVVAWIIGVSPDETVAAHFRLLPGAIAGLSVGFGLWGYHWAVVQREAEESEQESQGSQRFYAYVLALMGLVALAVAAGTLANVALTFLIESSRAILAGRDVWRVPVAAAITLIVLGGPLWGYYWMQIQRRVDSNGIEERRALSRRIFIFTVLGIGVLTLLGSVSSALFLLLRDLLEAGLDSGTARDVKIPLSIVIGVMVFLPYYWRVYIQDRQAEPDEAVPMPERRTRKQVSVMIGSGGEAFIRNLENALGYPVTTLRLTNPDTDLPVMTIEDCERIARQVDDSSGARVLLVPDGTSVRVLSYE